MCGNEAVPREKKMYSYAHKHTHINLKVSLYPGEVYLGEKSCKHNGYSIRQG